MPNITTNHAISHTNSHSASDWLKIYFIQLKHEPDPGVVSSSIDRFCKDNTTAVTTARANKKTQPDQWQRGKLGTGSCTKSFMHAIQSSNDIPILLLSHSSMEFLGLFLRHHFTT